MDEDGRMTSVPGQPDETSATETESALPGEAQNPPEPSNAPAWPPPAEGAWAYTPPNVTIPTYVPPGPAAPPYQPPVGQVYAPFGQPPYPPNAPVNPERAGIPPAGQPLYGYPAPPAYGYQPSPQYPLAYPPVPGASSAPAGQPGRGYGYGTMAPYPLATNRASKTPGTGMAAGIILLVFGGLFLIFCALMMMVAVAEAEEEMFIVFLCALLYNALPITGGILCLANKLAGKILAVISAAPMLLVLVFFVIMLVTEGSGGGNVGTIVTTVWGFMTVIPLAAAVLALLPGKKTP